MKCRVRVLVLFTCLALYFLGYAFLYFCNEIKVRRKLDAGDSEKRDVSASIYKEIDQKLTPDLTQRKEVDQLEENEVAIRERDIMTQAQQIPRSQENPELQHIFYNRVPKCGSRSLLTIADILALQLNYSTVEWTFRSSEWPDNADRKKQMEMFKNFQKPTLFQRHVVYIDFKKEGYKQPMYINVIRDPISRFVSRFNYHKYGDNLNSMKVLHPNWPDINKCILANHPACSDPKLLFYTGWYFCGIDEHCKAGSNRSVEQAIAHMDEDYVFIGITEEFNKTLSLLEKMLPSFFLGAQDIWKEIGRKRFKETTTIKRDTLNYDARNILKSRLAYEYEVYDHGREKFEKLLRDYNII